MKKQNTDWLNRPFRILDYAFNAAMDDIDVSEIVDFCRKLHADVIHFHCQDNMHGGFDENGMYFKSRCSAKKNRDLLGEFLPAAAEADLKTIVYVNLHWYTLKFANAHPDWQVIKRDGTPLTGLYGDDDSTFCINSPWREWSFRLLEDLCEYTIDGIFFDGPITFATRGGCFCAHCKEKYAREGFEQQLGRPFPTPTEADADNGRCLREFHVASMVDYYRDAVAVIRPARPQAVAYGNYGNVSESDYAAGRDNRRLVEHMDALLAEGGFMYGRPDLQLLFKTGASSRLYETQAEGKPAANAVSMAYSPWRWISLSAPETAVLLSQASIGVNPYYAVFYQGRKAPGVAAAARRYAFLEDNRAVLTGTRSAAKTALLHSESTLNTYAGVDIPWADIGYQKAVRSEAIGNFSRSFYGFYEMLVRARVPFDIVDEQTIVTGGLARYDSVILPNCACLGEAQCRGIEEYVSKGGTLVADFETSCYNEAGRRRRKAGLADLFGVDTPERVSDHRRWDYVFPAPDSAGLFQDAVGGAPYPAPRRNLPVGTTTGSALAFFSEPIASNIAADAEESDQPFLIRNTVGSGLSYYLPTQLGEFFLDSRPQGYPELLWRLLTTRAMVPIVVGGAPNLMEIRPRRTSDGAGLLVHLVNLELGPVDRIVPAERLTVLVVGEQYSTCCALLADKTLRLTTTDNGTQAELDRFDEYETLLFRQ